MTRDSLEKTELAPAMKHRAWSEKDIFARPAERRTVDLGMRIRAIPIMRTVSQMGTSGLSWSGVPGTLERTLTGTDSGCGFMVARVWSRETRSAADSPSPMMTPQQMVTPVLRT